MLNTYESPAPRARAFAKEERAGIVKSGNDSDQGEICETDLLFPVLKICVHSHSEVCWKQYSPRFGRLARAAFVAGRETQIS